RPEDYEAARPKERRAARRMCKPIRRDPLRAVGDMGQERPDRRAGGQQQEQHEGGAHRPKGPPHERERLPERDARRRGGTHGADRMLLRAGRSQAWRQRPGAKRWSGAIRYRVKVPVMSMMPIPTSNDPEATVSTR